jgi:hypothetical protein
MSGRIRTIKPELLEDTKTSCLTHLQFRLFVSLILLADDYGNLRASVGLIRGSAFWGVPDTTEEELETSISELEDLGLVETYSMRGQIYAHIKNWSKHQRVDKPGKPRVPSPKDPEVRPARPWVTYFIRLGKAGPIKIGRTFDVAARVRKLQTGAPEKLDVLRVLDGDFETALHQRFAEFRSHGEWFSPVPELLLAIETEPFANCSRIVRDPPAPDPDPDPDLGPTTPTPTVERRFDVGTAGAATARAVFEESVADATGKPFALNRAPFHDRDLVALLNTHGPPEPPPEVLSWLRGSVDAWVLATDPKYAGGWAPAKLLDWLNAGRPDRRSRAGPRSERQPHDLGWLERMKKTGTGGEL